MDHSVTIHDNGPLHNHSRNWLECHSSFPPPAAPTSRRPLPASRPASSVLSSAWRRFCPTSAPCASSAPSSEKKSVTPRRYAFCQRLNCSRTSCYIPRYMNLLGYAASFFCFGPRAPGGSSASASWVPYEGAQSRVVAASLEEGISYPTRV